ncbi:DinB family protein [Aneurinibacillus migulanus]|uniref:Damage-inducible protein DinB n=1 Tax=Aneurinibacillus migulanus TaxID=47500 RepID=A0A0D1WIF2_ANEMI|nr:DinB family protein [Aneurinibacillus migulanus]KIV58350.1 damage-inducible protein DinB [Aneurinibacillus migulanus]KON95917.1 damage-inducible protein DinB [Aneurinibacillus migulanus]MED0893417.1 DinB family protein [Aneurinibacillus migulanus]MED1616035.1 DinB family protein [Aneurinibacillus migulanus]SDJ16731.1 Uncharacterized damage-inducible protein DinB (forms a four-helix bundle) [Aneurinibacillus migulanus]
MRTIQKMYEHLNWANHRILEKLHNNKNGNQQIIDLFSHILYTEQVWITRLRGMDSSQLPIWSEANLSVCAELVRKNQDDFTALFANLTSADLDNLISYRNSKGKEFKTSIEDILTHVALHGQYHRGQINSRLRANRVEPVNTDYITFVR